MSCLKCFCTLFRGWSSKRCGNESAGVASQRASGLRNWRLPGTLSVTAWWRVGLFSAVSSSWTWQHRIESHCKEIKDQKFKKKTVKCECSPERPHIFKELALESPTTQLPQEALSSRKNPTFSKYACGVQQTVSPLWRPGL